MGNLLYLLGLTHMLNVEIGSVLGYAPGMDLGVLPPLSVIPEQELEIS